GAALSVRRRRISGQGWETVRKLQEARDGGAEGPGGQRERRSPGGGAGPLRRGVAAGGGRGGAFPAPEPQGGPDIRGEPVGDPCRPQATRGVRGGPDRGAVGWCGQPAP